MVLQTRDLRYNTLFRIPTLSCKHRTYFNIQKTRLLIKSLHKCHFALICLHSHILRCHIIISMALVKLYLLPTVSCRCLALLETYVFCFFVLHCWDNMLNTHIHTVKQQVAWSLTCLTDLLTYINVLLEMCSSLKYVVYNWLSTSVNYV